MIIMIFIGVFSDLVLWINGVALNVNYFLLPTMLLTCTVFGNLLLPAVQGRRHRAMPG